MSDNYRRARWDKGWSAIEDVCHLRGWWVEIGHNPDFPRPYCVHFSGSGRYFKTLRDAHAYCRGRKWMSGPDTIPVDADRCLREGWDLVEMIRCRKGGNVSILHAPMSEQPYLVLNRGRGYPFRSIHEARAFCYGRGWLTNSTMIYKEVANAV